MAARTTRDLPVSVRLPGPLTHCPIRAASASSVSSRASRVCTRSCGTSYAPGWAIRFFHVTGQPATYFRTGSGDTTLAYIQNLLFVVFALVGIALAWSVLDRKRPNYITLHAWLRLMVRYTVAFTLFSYGFAKVFRCSSARRIF